MLSSIYDHAVFDDGSETLYVMLSVDLYFARSNPFTSFVRVRKNYYMATFIMTLVTAILIGLLYEHVTVNADPVC